MTTASADAPLAGGRWNAGKIRLSTGWRHAEHVWVNPGGENSERISVRQDGQVRGAGAVTGFPDSLSDGWGGILVPENILIEP